MPQFYRGLYWFLGIYISCILAADAQFVKSKFQFESEIVKIIETENQWFVATATKGIYVSEDHGKNWSRRWLPRVLDPTAWDGFRQITILSIAFINNRLWAMTDAGMYASDDRGLNWRRISNPYEYLISSSPFYTSTYYRIVSQSGILYVSEQFFDPKQAKYSYRLLKSVDNGEHWSVLTSPPFSSLQLAATDQMILLATGSDKGAAVYSSNDQGQSWRSLTDSIPLSFINTVTAVGSNLLITGTHSVKDQHGSISSNTILATSLNAGRSWQIKERIAVNFVTNSALASVIQKQTFIVAMSNQIAYSNGDGQWQVDSLGLQSPNYIPEGGMTVINDTLWVGYQDKQLQSDQFALKGYLLYRPLAELSPDYMPAPSLLQADGQYRETIFLDWQSPNLTNSQDYFSLERAEGTPDNFKSIAQLTGNSFVDTQVNQGKLYYYRMRTERKSAGIHSKYSPVAAVAKTNVCVRAAYLNYFEDLQMPSSDSLFARAGSELVRSVDGGKSWSLLNPCFFNNQRYDPYFGKYISLSFPSSQIGYAMVGIGTFISTSNLLLKTRDGGTTWNLQPISQKLDIFKIIFTSESIGYALVSDGHTSGYLLYKTQNGGRDFQIVASAPRFTTLQYKNGLLLGNDNKDRVSFSSDQALTWSDTKRYSSTAHIFDTKRYVIGYSGGDSTYVRLTTDAGKTWQSAQIPLKQYDKILDIQFIDNLRGFLIGGSTTNSGTKLNFVYQTIDGGFSWTFIKQTEAAIGTATEIAFQGNRIVILYQPANRPSSVLGAIQLSEDAGKTWQFVNNLHNKGDYSLQTIAYRNEKEGIATTKASTIPGSTNQYFHYYTKDGGLTWLRATLNEPDNTWFVKFISADVGFRVGNNVVYYTIDGSKTWQKVDIIQFPCTNVQERQQIRNIPNNNGITHGCTIQFLSASNWVALSDDNKLYLTTNRGQSWKAMSTPTLQYPMFYFMNEQVGYVTVENKALGDQLWQTKDGGLTWAQVGSFDESSLFFLTEDIGFAGLKRTTDGGKHWYVQEDLVPPARQQEVIPNYRFLNDRIGYVGPSYYTTDGGAHWTALAYLSEDANNPYISLSDGTLLGVDRYFGETVRLVPANTPCSPLSVLGDTTLYVDKTPTSSYSSTVLGWTPNIGFNWFIDGGGKIQSDLSKATVNWTENANAVRTLSVKAVNDCGESAPAILKITTKVIVTALDPLSVSLIKLYPNPAQTKVMIDVSQLQPSPSVNWYDVNGKSFSVPGNLTTGFDVMGLPAGIYLVRLQTEKYNEVKRVIITR